jgi:chemotaxis protein MotB
LYSTAQVDQRKVGKLAMAIQVAFQELGVFPASNTKVPVDMSEPMPFNTVQSIPRMEPTAALGRFVPAAQGMASPHNGDMGTLRHELEKLLAPEISRQEVTLRYEPDGLVVSLSELGFFDSGSAEMKPKSRESFRRIAALLASRGYRLRIEGHTDNVPIHNAQFESNWELSTARATALVRSLILTYGYAPDRLSAAGYGEFHPITRNDIAAGRALNRRVDVIILTRQATKNVQSLDSSVPDTSQVNLPSVIPAQP